MDSSSQIIGGKYKEEEEEEEEECQSGESGWTMYIGSSIDDHDEEDEENQEEFEGDDDDDDDSGDSDDSMVSDASSRMALFSKDNLKGKENEVKTFSKGKKMSVEKNGYEERKERKGGVVSVLPAQSGNQVRRNNRVGKKK